MTKPERLGGITGLVSLGEHLDSKATREKVELLAFKRRIALRLAEEMEGQGRSKADMARRMGTSRAQLDRLLDPDAHNVTLETIARAAATLGKRLHLELV